MKPLVWMWLVALLGGGTGGIVYYQGRAMSRAEEAKALSLMRRWMVAQEVYAVQGDGRYASSLDPLIKEGLLELPPVAHVEDSGWTFQGYRFGMVEGADASCMGLCAVPAEGGVGELAWLALLDNNAGPPPEGGVQRGAGGLIYSTPALSGAPLVTSWPTPDELASTWQKRSLSVEEGSRQAREQFDKAMAR